MRETLYVKTLVRVALPATVLDDDEATNGTTVDLGVFGNDFRTVMFVVQTGTVTDGTHAFTLEESVNGTDWTAVPAARVQGVLPTVAAAHDDAVFSFGYIPSTQQYVRCVVTSASTTTGGVIGAVAVCSEGSNSPVARS
ncbi:hypothetical protein OG874_00525 [Nocardia sp. NBC_00565]|uniref:hypothetical protein n=1 Tax=Nocardia sp. NBC_00565 TaxID=2975993 RepID=UPI002E801622|nr:hypothetical protein [Nocardia sp. NBC_00565]WUC03740.1 hypothetical protein OG874_00525 [Nocardia sp. NBC_00565]